MFAVPPTVFLNKLKFARARPRTNSFLWGALAVVCLLLTDLSAFAQNTLTPSSLVFGNEVAGQASTAKSARFSNLNTVPVTITSITIAGGNAASDYAWGGNCPLSPNTLGVKQSCNIAVTFTPLALGSRTATLTVTDTAKNSPLSVALTGTGMPPLTLSARSLSFPSRQIGTTSAPQSVTVTNHLDSELLFSSIVASTGFSVSSNTCGSGIALGATCKVGVTFTPGIVGQQQGTLTINDSAITSPNIVALSGTGNETGLTSIGVTPANPAVGEGNTEQFAATAYFKNGSTANITPFVTWKSSVAGVATITSAGLATAAAPGGTNISATLGSVAGSTTLTVTTVSLVSIAVTPANPSILAGSTQQFTATGTYSDSSTQNLTSTVTWSSSTTNVATISNSQGSQGLSTAVAPGSAIISATSGAISGSTTLTVTGGFVATGGLITGRGSDTSTVLNSGMVLIAGGGNSGGYASTAELYNPATAAFAPAGSLNTPRQLHTATVLNNSAVLLAGGFGSGGALASAETYNPATGTFTTTGPLHSARYYHTATVLNNGTVLLTGGLGSSGALAAAEIYNPGTGVFTPTGNLNTARWAHTATLLNNGMVLIAGGYNSSGFLASVELYNPASGSFTITRALNTARENHSATLLNNGTVLIAGGYNSSGYLSSTELYSPITGTFAFTGSMTTARENHTATLLSSGIVLAAGGIGGSGILASAEAYDPVAGTFSSAGNLINARENHTATLLNNGTVLLAGGVGSTSYLSSAELYEPASLTPPNLASIALSPGNATLPLGTAQQFIATGTFSGDSTQQLNSVTWSSSNTSVISVTSDATDPGSAYAVGSGGTAVLSACAGAVCGTASLTVTAPSLVSITVSPANGTLLLNSSQQFDAMGTYSDGSTMDLTSTATWNSSTTNVAAISPAGLATAVTTGNTIISATLGNISGSTMLTVTAASLVSIAVTPANASITAGSAQQFTATGTYSDTSTQNLTNSVTWTSSAPNIATISNAPGTQGLAAGMAAGTTTVSAASGSINGSTTMSVTPAVATGVLTQYTSAWGGLQRIYYVYVPKIVAATPSMVLFLHDTWNLPSIPLNLVPQFEALADQYGFYMVWPISTYNSATQSWYWDCDGCESTFAAPPDDSGFIRSIILTLQNQYGVSSGQTFVTGMSSGGYMTQRVGMEQSDIIAAIAPVSGAQYIQPVKTTFVPPVVPNPISVYRLNGDDDSVVPYCGGTKGFWANTRALSPSGDSDVDFWAGQNANQCSGMAQSQTLCTNAFPANGVVEQDASACNGGAEVIFEREIGVAHVWVPGTEIKVWAFFQAHAR